MVFLKFHSLVSDLCLLKCFHFLNLSLVSETLFEQLLITKFFGGFSLGVKSLLGGVVPDELQVALSVQNELLSLGFLLALLFVLPLSLEHVLLVSVSSLLLISLHVSGVLLPVKDSHSVSNGL